MNEISRRQFGATVGAGSLYTAVHQLLGAAPVSAQAARPVVGSELCEMSAVELASRLARKQVSAREVMTAHLAQIERLNPKVNAIVTLAAEQALAGAAKADETIARRGPMRAAWSARCAHGSRRHGGHSHDTRIVVLLRQRALISQQQANAKNHGDYVSGVAALTNYFQQLDFISGDRKGAILSDVARDH